MSRLVVYLGWTALALSVFYSMTAIVYSGCEVSYSLVLKPWPMWGWGYGGAEGDCYWANPHPGIPEPWWLSAPRLVYASMEDHNGGMLRTVYFLGLVATLILLSPLVLLAGAIGAVRHALKSQRAA